MAVGLMGGMMAGPAVLEYGYNAAVWSAPYVKSAAVATYNAGKYAYTVSSNAAKYYGSTAIINGVKEYGKTKMMAEIGYMAVNNTSNLPFQFASGLLLGFIKGALGFPIDTPSVCDNLGINLISDFVSNCISVYQERNK